MLKTELLAVVKANKTVDKYVIDEGKIPLLNYLM